MRARAAAATGRVGFPRCDLRLSTRTSFMTPAASQVLSASAPLAPRPSLKATPQSIPVSVRLTVIEFCTGPRRG